LGLALDGAPMLGLPVVRLLTESNELLPEMPAIGPEEKREEGEFAKASPKPVQDGTKIGLGMGIVEANNRRGDWDQRSLLGWKNQRIGVGVHALTS
jgi:hypothetical protein